MNQEKPRINVEALLYLPLPASKKLVDYLTNCNSILSQLLAITDEMNQEKAERNF